MPSKSINPIFDFYEYFLLFPAYSIGIALSVSCLYAYLAIMNPVADQRKKEFDFGLEKSKIPNEGSSKSSGKGVNVGVTSTQQDTLAVESHDQEKLKKKKKKKKIFSNANQKPSNQTTTNQEKPDQKASNQTTDQEKPDQKPTDQASNDTSDAQNEVSDDSKSASCTLPIPSDRQGSRSTLSISTLSNDSCELQAQQKKDIEDGWQVVSKKSNSRSVSKNTSFVSLESAAAATSSSNLQSAATSLTKKQRENQKKKEKEKLAKEQERLEQEQRLKAHRQEQEDFFLSLPPRPSSSFL